MAVTADIHIGVDQVNRAEIEVVAAELDVECPEVVYKEYVDRPWLNWFTGGVVIALVFAILVCWVIS